MTETTEELGRAALTRKGVLLDTGPLVALYARNDKHHRAVTQWLHGFTGQLHTVESVLAEAAFLLPTRIRPLLAEFVVSGAVKLHQPNLADYPRIAELLRKYADLDPDWADIALVWLAETSGIHRIATLDTTDFGVYRIKGRKRFEMELLG